jgi:outer membrane protein assembly factor BamB
MSTWRTYDLYTWRTNPRSAAVAAIVLVLAVETRPDLAAEEALWPEFRGPTGQGLSSAGSLPLEWSPTRNVAWKSAIPGRGWSSPIVRGGAIFLTTAVAAEGQGGERGPQSLRALKLDLASGSIAWDVEVFRHEGARIHAKNSHASATPITDGEHLYVHFGTHGTASLDLDGRVLWRNRELRYAPVHGSGGSAVLAGRALVVHCDGSDRQFVAALDRTTGAILWRAERPWDAERGFSFSTPLLIEAEGREELVSPASGGVVAYDP